MFQLTPSLPQPVEFPGWKVPAPARRQSILRPYKKSAFKTVRFDDWNSFDMLIRKRKRKMHKDVKFRTFIGLFFNWHYGSERVNVSPGERVFVCSDSHFYVRPTRPLSERLLKGNPFKLSDCWLVKCCFMSAETVGLLGTGAQDGHLDSHTAELWTLG